MINNIFNSSIMDRVEKSGIIAVLELEREDDAIPVVDALMEGGITAIELTLRTSAALASMKRIAKERPAMTIGAGTVIFIEQVQEVVDAGAHFGVSPGFNSIIVDEAIRIGFPFAPGIATPSELEWALSKGCMLLKFFPAEPSGGVSYLKSMNAPYAYLGLSYIPLGGVNENNLSTYAAFKPIVGVGGSWIAPRDLINSHAWAEITRRSNKAKQIWEQGREAI